MNEQLSSIPSICIDLKKSRLRIHRNTLYQLNSPKYIEFLVSPARKSLIIRSSSERKNAHRILFDWLGKDNQCYELYSREFIREIQNVNDRLESNRSYRINGCVSHDGNAALFSLEKAILIESGKEESLYA